MRGHDDEVVQMSNRPSARLLIAVLVAASVFPAGGALATEHCDNPVNFLSGVGLLLNPRTVGCDGIAEDFPETPEDDSNTDWIMPGATQGVVRWTEGGQPADGVQQEDGSIVGSQIQIGEVITPLRFSQGEGLDGSPGDFWDSQPISITRSDSMTGIATITVCRDEACEDAETVVYRGVAA